MVGNEMLRVLSQREFPSERVIALASERSKGLTVAYNGGSITVDELKESAFKGIDIALFAASGDIALMYGPVAAEAGALVIDNSSAWRMKQNVPLVVPEVNSEDIRDNETRKILHDPELRITATCVRVPVPVGHGESVFIETTEAISADEVRELLATSPGVVVEDDPHAKLYPTPHGVAGKDEVFVGRIRDDASTRHGLVLWIVSDNLRKGAALNAVQIAEQAVEMGVVGR